MKLAAVLLLAAAWACAADPASELIFPPEKWHNHSSSIVELPGGDLLACWFHGSGERQADDVVIRAARWSKASRAWSEPFLLADTPGFPDTNPVLFVDKQERLFLFWPAIIANQWETALMKYRISTDYRQPAGPPKWEHQDNILLIPKNIVAKTEQLLAQAPPSADPRAPEYIAKLREHAADKYFSRMGWFTRTHPLELPSGRLLVPMYSDGYSYGIMAISDDHGYTWTASEPIVGFGGIQPSVVRGKDGVLVAYLRDNGPPPKRVQVSYSKDDGVSWTVAKDTAIPNPGASIEAIALASGKWLMVYNDVERGRWSLAAALSDDEGATWKHFRHLEGDPAVPTKNSFHYPSVIQAKDGSIHVTYSHFTPAGKSIKHVRFTEDWIQAGDPKR
ncbi:MAG: exo-alpha-sialidase [Acidobacteria bacterium]|nr:exo-alpha-sialidase [Acidobacteriota bacterium]